MEVPQDTCMPDKIAEEPNLWINAVAGPNWREKVQILGEILNQFFLKGRSGKPKGEERAYRMASVHEGRKLIQVTKILIRPNVGRNAQNWEETTKINEALLLIGKGYFCAKLYKK